ncbi:MAG: M14 family zinc carboxypeptidase [Fibrobacteria bacterium]
MGNNIMKAFGLSLIMGLGLGLSLGVARAAAVPDSSNGWGYGYDSLLSDLGEWRKNPLVRVDSVGASVKGRAIWMITVTGPEDSLGRPGEPGTRKHRVFIHARTHPAEVQANYVAREAIRFLLDSGAQSADLRKEFIFNFVPMYNPDGVEEGHSRQNSHLVDLESNWDQQVLEPEVTVLKRTFEAYMAGPTPIDVALNLHSDQYSCSRFFVFHLAVGTSPAYEVLEKQFIGQVQSHFPDGIKNFDYQQTWGTGTAARYPEGFWWLQHREKVMALTYEDANCLNATRFDSTAKALMLGSADYIRARIVAAVRRIFAGETRMLLVPEGVRLTGMPSGSRWELADIRGRRLAQGSLWGESILPWSAFPAAPARILSVFAPGGDVERIRLPNPSN